MTVRGANQGEIFKTYLEQVLVPQQQLGQVVVMDTTYQHLKWLRDAGVH